MIYDCDPADTISALRAANEDLLEQVKHWKGEFEIVRKASRLFESACETSEFNLRAAKSELEIADGEINRLNEVIEKYRAVSQPNQLREDKQFNETSRDWEICSAIDNYRTAARQGSELTLSDFLKEVGWALVPSSNGAEGAEKAPDCTLSCAMAKHDGVTCPDDSCDIEQSVRSPPAPPQPAPDAMRLGLTPKEFVDTILSACDPSNWDAERHQGECFIALKEAYEGIHEIAAEFQTAMYAWPKVAAPVPSPDGAITALRDICDLEPGTQEWIDRCTKVSATPDTELLGKIFLIARAARDFAPSPSVAGAAEPVAWRWQHVNDRREPRPWHYEDAPWKGNEYMQAEPLYTVSVSEPKS